MKTLNLMKGLFLVIITICAGETFGQVYIDSSGNVGIGDSMPGATLDVEGTFQLQNGSQGENLVLTSDSSGNATWQKINTLNMFDILPQPYSDNLNCLRIVGSLDIGSQPASIAVQGDYAYVADWASDDLKIIDVRNPSNPALTGSLDLNDNPNGYYITVQGNYAYVVDRSNDLKVIDVSNPESPALAGFLNIAVPLSVAVQDSLAYVVGALGLEVIDVSSPASPSKIGSLSIGLVPFAVAVQDSFVCVVGSFPGLEMIDVSNPASPTSAGSLSFGSQPISVAMQGNYAYVVDPGSDDIKVIDISDPVSPALASSLSIGPDPRSVKVQGDYAYVVDAGSDDIKVVDVSDPSSPTLASSLGIGPGPRSIAVQGNFAYVVDTGSNNFKEVQLFCENETFISIDPTTGDLEYRSSSWKTDTSSGNIFNLNLGNVGIGNVIPTNPLTVFSSSNIRPLSIESDLFQTGLLLKGTQGGFNSTFQLIMDNPSIADGQAIRMNVVDDGINYWEFFTANRTADNFGNLIFNECDVGIGTASPTEKLHVVGNICYTGSSAACSDIRYKTSFLTIPNALQKITSLNGVYYHWNQEMFPDKDFSADRQIGVIAQEVEALFPEMVLTDQDGYKSVDYSRLTPVLIEAIKELQDKVIKMEEMERRLAKLEAVVLNAAAATTDDE